MRTKAERQGPKKAGPVLSVLLMLLLLLMAAVVTLSYPFFAPFVAYRRWQTRQFVKRMAAANRVMERPCFELALEEKRGTVIEEWVPFKVGAGPLRRWWTADDVRNVSPYSPPEDGAEAIREEIQPVQ